MRYGVGALNDVFCLCMALGADVCCRMKEPGMGRRRHLEGSTAFHVERVVSV
jgi:hypothetical protein